MHVLMPVDEIRRPPERLHEGRDLRLDLARERRRVQPAQHCEAQRHCERMEDAVFERRVVRRERLEWRRQREMQSDRGACRPLIERLDLGA